MTEREHKPYYVRRIDQQILDALLRIEELLNRPKAPAAVELAPAADIAPKAKRK